MAGLDKKRQSDYIGMLMELGGDGTQASNQKETDPIQVCSQSIKSIQMASETLLLTERDQPLSKQPFSGCCDTLVARRKDVSIATESIVADLSKPELLCGHLASLTEAVCVITETTAQAVFMVGSKSAGGTPGTPSAVDHYKVSRARLAIQIATDNFEKNSLSEAKVLTVAAVVSTHLDVLREQCNAAAALLEPTNSAQSRQFRAIGKAIVGSAAMLVASIKAFVVQQTDSNRHTCSVFSKPVLATIDALVEFVGSVPSLIGTPPQIKKDLAKAIEPIQASALSVVSAATAVKKVLINPSDREAVTNVKRYAGSINDSLAALVTATKQARDTNM